MATIPMQTGAMPDYWKKIFQTQTQGATQGVPMNTPQQTPTVPSSAIPDNVLTGPLAGFNAGGAVKGGITGGGAGAVVGGMSGGGGKGGYKSGPTGSINPIEAERDKGEYAASMYPFGKDSPVKDKDTQTAMAEAALIRNPTMNALSRVPAVFNARVAMYGGDKDAMLNMPVVNAAGSILRKLSGGKLGGNIPEADPSKQFATMMNATRSAPAYSTLQGIRQQSVAADAQEQALMQERYKSLGAAMQALGRT